MAAPGTPTNFNVQKGNNTVYLSWDPQLDASSGFVIQRSNDGVTFSNIATPASGYDYVDNTAALGTQYWYQIAATNGVLSPFAGPVIVVPTAQSFMSLWELRLLSQQRADRVGSTFVTKAEWNQFINQSYHELYDLLTTLYEDYNVAPPFAFATDGRVGGLYPLPDGITLVDAQTNQIAKPFFKLLGVDMGLSASASAWATMKKFDFIGRNRYVFPQVTSAFLGIFNMRYRLLANQIQFIPTPAAGQFMRLWYVPRMTDLVKDYDIVDGVSGWTEYIVVDAAIKALLKEESDVTMLMTQKQMLQKRIEESGMNRDAGQPDCISDVRSAAERMGGFGSPFGDGWS